MMNPMDYCLKIRRIPGNNSILEETQPSYSMYEFFKQRYGLNDQQIASGTAIGLTTALGLTNVVRRVKSKRTFNNQQNKKQHDQQDKKQHHEHKSESTESPFSRINLDPNKSYTEKEIKSAYYKASKKYHPDSGGSKDEFQKLQDELDALLKKNGYK